MITSNTVNIEVLSASEGHKLTQASEEVSMSQRIISDRIFLAVTDKAENYKEITDEEANSILEEQEKLRKEYFEKQEQDNKTHLNTQE